VTELNYKSGIYTYIILIKNKQGGEQNKVCVGHKTTHDLEVCAHKIWLGRLYKESRRQTHANIIC
jgi:hypothetical protein